MLWPGRLAVATLPPVGPAAARRASDDDVSTSRVFPAVVLNEATSHASVIPAGAVNVPSAFTDTSCTSMVSATLVVIDGVATAVPAGFIVAFTASTGEEVSTPA